MWRPYLELLRPANVATAVADVLAGFAVAGLAAPRALPWLIGASACLYAGGVVLNDVFDREIDAVERPERPLPSGRIRTSQAARLGGTLLTLGVLTAFGATATAGIVAVAIAGFVLLYDAWGKRHPIVGPINMGLCRGLNLLLGVAAFPEAIATNWPVALLPITYISGVTALSRGEVTGGRKGTAGLALALLAVVVLALGLLSLLSEQPAIAGLVLTLTLAWLVLPAFWAAYQHPDPRAIRNAVRTGVVSLVLLDAVIATSYAGVSYGAVLLATGLVARWLARFFAVT